MEHRCPGRNKGEIIRSCLIRYYFPIHLILEKYNIENKKQIEIVSGEVMNVFLEYNWPGNVRELENVIERAVGGGVAEILTRMIPFLRQLEVYARWDVIKERLLFKEIKPHLDSPEAIVITGTRRTGKITLLNFIYNKIPSKQRIRT